ncbi:motile sperm domain-containing protein 1-like [Ptychodera flava]|uniref:motile sperm domain-containing protein 1-like n=1 Tax=Ptychodera flava TaxID=63121 RepID=UPI00396A8CD8
MHLGSNPRLLEQGKLPVFVFPTELVFYADDKASHKQVLTVYNPYDFTLKFKVLSTSPKKYVVVDSEGTIKQGCCIDIVIRHADVQKISVGSKDKFRLNIFEHGQRKVIGKKDIPAILLPSSTELRISPERDVSRSPERRATQRRDSQSSDAFKSIGRARSGPSAIIVLIALSCIVALMLPSEGEKDSRLPEYVYLTVNQKLIAAYILGLVTMVILRT